MYESTESRQHERHRTCTFAYLDTDLRFNDTSRLPGIESSMEDKLILSTETNFLPTATVLLCVSRSRRWKSASTPSTPALSAARSPSVASPLVSGTAALASAPWPVVLTPLRTSTHPATTVRHSGDNERNEAQDEAVGRQTRSITKLTFVPQHPCRCCYALDSPSSERDCRGLKGTRSFWGSGTKK